MKLKDSFNDYCMSMLGCVSGLVIFFWIGGYVCYMSLFKNTIGIWGWLIGGVLLFVLPVIAWIVLVGLWNLVRDAWLKKRKSGEDDDSMPPEEARRPVDPYEAAVLPQLSLSRKQVKTQVRRSVMRNPGRHPKCRGL